MKVQFYTLNGLINDWLKKHEMKEGAFDILG